MGLFDIFDNKSAKAPQRPAMEAATDGSGDDIATRLIEQLIAVGIDGKGPAKPASEVADKALADADGNVEKAINKLCAGYLRTAAGAGFLTGLGGFVTMPVALPANIVEFYVVGTRMVAGVAHLRGYDLDSPQVRNAVLLAVLGKDAVRGLVRDRTVPGPPMVLATAPAHDPALDAVIAGEVASALVSRVIGKRAAGVVVRRVPVAGGVWGGGADAWSTHQLGRYAAEELRQRPRPAVSG